jgi:hypothetical protein
MVSGIEGKGVVDSGVWWFCCLFGMESTGVWRLRSVDFLKA